MAFTAGQKLRANDLNAISTAVTSSVAADSTTTSVTFVDTDASVAFTAPPSGKVMVYIAGDIWSSSAADAAELDFRLSGPSTRAAAGATALRVFGTNGARSTVVNVITGLTANGAYTCTMQKRSSNVAATSHAQNRTVIVSTLA